MTTRSIRPALTELAAVSLAELRHDDGRPPTNTERTWAHVIVKALLDDHPELVRQALDEGRAS